MDNTTSELLARLLITVIFAVPISKIALLTFLRPYRNILMYWYMTRFDRHYKEAKQTFNELVYKQRVCERETKSTQEAYTKFFELLLEDDRFKSTFGKQSDGTNKTHTTDDFFSEENTFMNDVETFCCFYGQGIELHKVQVIFFLDEGICLSSINLLYHEEAGRKSFSKDLEKKKFYRDSDGGRKRKRVVAPTPVSTIA